MTAQAARCGETSPTFNALVRLFSSVGTLMCGQGALLELGNGARSSHTYTAFLQCGSSHALSRRPSLRNDVRNNRICMVSPRCGSSHACALWFLPGVVPLMRVHIVLPQETLST